MIPIRGAITIEKNSIEQIKDNSIYLMDIIMKQNGLLKEHIKVLLFSCTKDITKAYPGKFIREYFQMDQVAIMHYNEMDVEDSLGLCIRVLVLVEKQDMEKGIPIYLKEARKLRKDQLNSFPIERNL